TAANGWSSSRASPCLVQSFIFQTAKPMPPPSRTRNANVTASIPALPYGSEFLLRRPGAAALPARFVLTGSGSEEEGFGTVLTALPTGGVLVDGACVAIVTGAGAMPGLAENVCMQIKHSTSVPAAISLSKFNVEPQCGQVNCVAGMARLPWDVERGAVGSLTFRGENRGNSSQVSRRRSGCP